MTSPFCKPLETSGFQRQKHEPLYPAGWNKERAFQEFYCTPDVNGRTKMIGHRGLEWEPQEGVIENSLISIVSAIIAGARTEFDIRFALHDIVMIYHDLSPYCHTAMLDPPQKFGEKIGDFVGRLQQLSTERGYIVSQTKDVEPTSWEFIAHDPTEPLITRIKAEDGEYSNYFVVGLRNPMDVKTDLTFSSLHMAPFLCFRNLQISA